MEDNCRAINYIRLIAKCVALRMEQLHLMMYVNGMQINPHNRCLDIPKKIIQYKHSLLAG